MMELQSPSLDEFIERARDMGVRRMSLLSEGVELVILFRPLENGERRRVNVEHLPRDTPLGSEVVVWLCRSLALEPHDFGVFVG
ncbi:hypothetical protein G6O69_12315 [Pseudenhygromyxa sp. WMMC2535]|uniref:hypothetical protein n=1 Tax=Pseudenhygromyxa sp. WMMC2535 TaxID=2712867 RepID=UPI00159563B0|nr:hypothetical protein [Pseudenhygromyxa sp. WMMC2535]NVB38616.1 hypothetical protein [Pseudenhygromyxa sp. WMMC2535]